MAVDEMLVETQRWLHAIYGENPLFTIDVPTNGTGRGTTIKGLIQALQIEVEAEADGIWGGGTSSQFNSLFPSGLSSSTVLENEDKLKRIVCILQGAFYTARGIIPGGLDGAFGNNLTSAVKKFQEQVGVTQDGIVRGYLMKAILTTDSYLLVSGGDENIRTIQRDLNNKYGDKIGLIATNGLYEKKTNKALISAIQIEVNSAVDGLWGEGTMSKLPTLRRYGTVTNKQMVYILQYLLYVNGYNPNGFDGGFGAGVESAVKLCQQDYNLTPDGVCGRQTWAALAVSCGDTSRTALACDTRFELTSDKIQYIYNLGCRVVGRYLTGGNFKQIRPGELQRILDAGLSFFPIFQESGSDINYFTEENGRIDALSAKHAAKKYGIDSGNVIYFAVDLDATDSQIDNNIIPYFEKLSSTISSTADSGATYKVGIYGTRKVCKKVLNKGYAITAFVSDMSTGWEGNLGETIPKSWTFDQFKTIKKIETASGTWDLDIVSYNSSSNFKPISKLGTPGLAGHCTIRKGVYKYYLGTARQLHSSKGQLFNVLSDKMQYHISYGLSTGELSDAVLLLNLYEFGNNEPIIKNKSYYEPGRLYDSEEFKITKGVDKYFTYDCSFFADYENDDEAICDIDVYIST